MSSPDYAYENKGVRYENVDNPENLEVGDHICYFQFPYYHHAIVEEINRLKLTLIGWSLWQREIVRYDLQLKVGSRPYIYRYIYTRGCYKPEYVLERARHRLGETGYNVITNFARAFPRWCKIGRGSLTHDDRLAEDRFKINREEANEAN